MSSNRTDAMPRDAPEPSIHPSCEIMTPPALCSRLGDLTLFLDQENNKSLHLNSPSNLQPTKERIEKDMQPQEQQSELPEADKVESYNSWKAKNAHALHDITGSLGRTKSSTTQALNSPKPHYTRKSPVVSSPKVNHVRRPQVENAEYYIPQGYQVATSSPIGTSQVPHNIYINHGNKPRVDTFSRTKENFTHCIVGPQSTNCRSNDKHNHETHYRTNDSYPCPKDCHCSSKESQNHVYNPSSQEHMHKHSKAKEIQVDTVYPQCNSYNTQKVRGVYSRDISEQQSPAYRENGCNQDQCCCDQVKIGNNPTNEMEIASRNIPFTKNASTLNITHINHSVTELYSIVHLLGEQILVLQQQVKQIQLQLPQIVPSNCEQLSKPKSTCQKCSCTHNNDRTSEGSYANSNNNKNSGIQSQTIPEEINLKSPNVDRPKRSVGVMTSSTPEIENKKSTLPDRVKPITQKISTNQTKSKRKIAQKKHSPSYLHQKESNERKLLKEKGKKEKIKNVPSPLKNSSNGGLESRGQVEKSFSLNELELKIRPEEEEEVEDDDTVYSSIKVDMPDYIDSDESDSSESSSDTEESEESGAETEESSDPQLGWTFYNGVVGQMNNILHRKQNPYRKDKPQIPRSIAANRIYPTGNTDYDTGNNWSKRVTFDGPPVEDSDNNIPNMAQVPWFHQAMPSQQYRPNGGPGRMQDFMMFNIANGNTNHSYSTLRYLERYDVLPSQKGPEIPENLFQEHKKSSKSKKKKKNKQKVFDIFS